MPFANPSAISKIPLPSKANFEIYELCSKVAAQYIAFKRRERLYRLDSFTREASGIRSKICEQLYLRFNQRNDDSLVLMVARKLGTAFDALSNTSSDFNLYKLINTAYAQAMGDTEYA